MCLKKRFIFLDTHQRFLEGYMGNFVCLWRRGIGSGMEERFTFYYIAFNYIACLIFTVGKDYLFDKNYGIKKEGAGSRLYQWYAC